MTLTAVFSSIRAPFLILTVVCVFLGASTVVASKVDINGGFFVLALLGALSAHISVNMLNEYLDFKSGLDLMTKKTKFSGGSGGLVEAPDMLNVVLVFGLVFLLITTSIGGYFVWVYGIKIIPIGAVGLALIVLYTRWINRHPFICLIAPGIGFAVLMVVGTQFVLQGEYTLLPWIVSIAPFFLINNLLLLNQYPDIQADASVGRYHLPIAYGVSASNITYAVCVLLAALAIIISTLSGALPPLSWLALLPMPLAMFSLYGALKHGEDIGYYPQYLGANVAVTVLVPFLLGISLVMG